MAEINIQKKKTPIWPWILLILIIIIAAAVFFMNREDRDEDYDPAERDTIGYSDRYQVDTISSSPFSEYVRDSSQMIDENNERYVKRSFALLADEMRDVFQNDTINGQPARQKIDSLVNQARSINAEQMQLNGERVRYAAQTAAEIITSLQTNRYRTTDTERNEIRKAADNIVSNKPVKDQQNEIKEFFEKTANFLERVRSEGLEV
jgi:hypothetical protein